MTLRKAHYRGDGLFSITDDPDYIIANYISWTISDILQKYPSEMAEFIKKFDPLGKDHYIYDAASASRTYYPPTLST